MRKAEKEDTSRIGYYFRKETGLLLVVTVTGILYNIGMVAGPWFEGQLVQYLCDILGGRRAPAAMLRRCHKEVRIPCHCCAPRLGGTTCW